MGSVKKDVLEKFCEFHRKTFIFKLFNEVTSCGPATRFKNGYAENIFQKKTPGDCSFNQKQVELFGKVHSKFE